MASFAVHPAQNNNSNQIIIHKFIVRRDKIIFTVIIFAVAQVWSLPDSEYEFASSARMHIHTEECIGFCKIMAA